MIDTGAVEKLVDVIEGQQSDLNLGYVIDMQKAIQELQCGASMSFIVQTVVEELEQQIIERLLILTQGNKSEAARRLRMDYKTLYRKMQKYAVS